MLRHCLKSENLVTNLILQKVLGLSEMKLEKYSIGLDVGATKVVGVLLFLSFKKSKCYFRVIKQKGFNWSAELKQSEAIGNLIDLLQELSLGYKVDNIGIGIAGVLDSKRERILVMQNFRLFNNLQIKQQFTARFDEKIKIKIKIENDANCFVWGEYLVGAGIGVKSLFGVTLGTGLGGGIIIDGKIVQGTHGSAGEIGQMIVDINNKLTLEDLASSHFFSKFSKESPKEIKDKARQGDKKSIDIYKEFGVNLGIGLANLINVLNPEKIVIGGGISYAWPFFINQTKEMVKKFVISPLAKETKVMRGKLGKEAVAIGAALL